MAVGVYPEVDGMAPSLSTGTYGSSIAHENCRFPVMFFMYWLLLKLDFSSFWLFSRLRWISSFVTASAGFVGVRGIFFNFKFSLTS